MRRMGKRCKGMGKKDVLCIKNKFSNHRKNVKNNSLLRIPPYPPHHTLPTMSYIIKTSLLRLCRIPLTTHSWTFFHIRNPRSSQTRPDPNSMSIQRWEITNHWSTIIDRAPFRCFAIAHTRFCNRICCPETALTFGHAFLTLCHGAALMFPMHLRITWKVGCVAIIGVAFSGVFKSVMIRTPSGNGSRGSAISGGIDTLESARGTVAGFF